MSAINPSETNPSATKLPDFDLTLVNADLSEQTITLPDYIKQSGKGLILYCYPKDNTKGCTVQAVDFSHYAKQFAQKGYTILGVSKDSTKSHQKFITAHNLTIGLISDSTQQLLQHLNVIAPKTLYGKQVMGVVRSSFVFDQNGILIDSFYQVKAQNHAEFLLQHLPQLNSQPDQ